jgi:hypothetical protein
MPLLFFARLGGPPAIGHEFKTIDFLTLIDVRRIPDRVRTRFFNKFVSKGLCQTIGGRRLPTFVACSKA